MESIIMFIVGLLLPVGIWFALKKPENGETKIDEVAHFSTIERFHSLGELNVYKVVTKEIVTARDHAFGEIGQKYFRWLLSNKKMAIIFQFDIDFKYDLNAPEFEVVEKSDGAFEITMPEVEYDTNIKDIKFYDEQGAKLLPWLLPSLVTAAFSDGFDEASKNKLIEEAKVQVAQMAEEFAASMRGDVENSARKTLESIAKSFGATQVLISFTGSKGTMKEITYEPEEKSVVA